MALRIEPRKTAALKGCDFTRKVYLSDVLIGEIVPTGYVHRGTMYDAGYGFRTVDANRLFLGRTFKTVGALIAALTAKVS